jgi:hypothetical protein
MAKYLTETEWKALVQKAKVADNGLQRALASYEKVGDEKYDDKLKALDLVSSLAGKLRANLTDGLKTAKAQKASPDVIKNLTAVLDYLPKVIDAAETEKQTVKAAAAKAAADAKPAATAKTVEKPIIERLTEAAEGMSGTPGNHMRKVMAIVNKAGSSYKSLWHYNNHAVFQFVKYDQKQSVREEMAKAGGGKLPFKGDMWVVQPFVKKLNMHCPPGCPDKSLMTFLKSLDDDIVNSLDPMFKAQGTEVASAFGPSVDEFIKHVGSLASDKGHLYSAY